MRLMSIIRWVFNRSPPEDETSARLDEASRRTEAMAQELHKLAETPNPMTGDRDPFGALVHAMRGTYHRRQLEQEGWTGTE